MCYELHEGRGQEVLILYSFFLFLLASSFCPSILVFP